MTADVAGDFREPGAASAAVADVIPVTPGFDQRFLRQVFSGTTITRDSGAESDQMGTFAAQRRLSLKPIRCFWRLERLQRWPGLGHLPVS